MADSGTPEVESATGTLASPEVEAPARPVPVEEPPYPPIRYSWYVVGVLTVFYVFSFMDRQILTLLVAPVRRDLAITDFEISLLMGAAFAIFYTFFGIPLGWLADSKNRVGLIGAGLVVWSIMTAGCGLARKFWHLASMRIGVGIGEAALSPAAYSLITDYFPRNKLATAISVYSMGIYLGSGLALCLPSFLFDYIREDSSYRVPFYGELRGWQMILVMLGLPGVLLAPLLLTVREPFRRGMGRQGAVHGGAKARQYSLWEVMAYLVANRRTILCHNIGFALLSFSSYGCSAWIPAFLVRTHGLTMKQAGISYGLIIGIVGTLGVVAGGRIADGLARRGRRDAKMLTGFIAAVGWLPTGLLYPLASDGFWARALLVPTVFFACMPFGAAAAAIQEMMPNPMRAQASAVFLFFVNLIGLGLGPSVVAAATDFLFRDDLWVWASLMLVGTAAHVVAATLLWFGRRPFQESMDRLQAWTRANA